jgi:hypothetical protein
VASSADGGAAVHESSGKSTLDSSGMQLLSICLLLNVVTGGMCLRMYLLRRRRQLARASSSMV